MSRPLDSANVKILVVDDDEDTREMLRVILSIFGYQVTTVGSVGDGLKIAKAAKFNIYILDSWFADGLGIELCEQLRAFDPTTPILFYSGVGYERDIQNAFAAGADAYLVKPTDVEQLESSISQLLHNGDRKPESPAKPMYRFGEHTEDSKPTFTG